MNKIWNAVIFMTLNFHKKPQRDFVFHFFFNFYYSLFILFVLLFIFFLQHADVHATACWRIGSYAPGYGHEMKSSTWGFHLSSLTTSILIPVVFPRDQLNRIRHFHFETRGSCKLSLNFIDALSHMCNWFIWNFVSNDLLRLLFF